MNPEKHQGWIVTYTGKKFRPLDPDPTLICIEDIAHALSNMCRWGGHTKRFYSVAQHSVLLAKYAYEVGYKNRPSGMLMLMHDAGEAYFADIARPVKELLPGIRGIENRLDECIAQAFNLQWPWPAFVKELDGMILEDERLQLTSWTGEGYPSRLNLVIDQSWCPEYAEHQFLKMYEELKN